MKIYKYKSYEEYVKEQTKVNKQKLDRVSMQEQVAVMISDYVKKNILSAKFGICHGVRNAWEVKKFRELLGFNIIGTEISDTAEQFDNTIQWDFHDVKDEWVNNVDFIYSNSLDHSYDPEHCLSQWVSCLSDAGRCFIEWSLMCEVPKKGLKHMKADCFGADLSEYRDLLSKNFMIVNELNITLETEWVKKRNMEDKRVIFVIKGKI
jgi:hypothetical protein